jgi:glycosyltransferase involved in cell wall biosynthesis
MWRTGVVPEERRRTERFSAADERGGPGMAEVSPRRTAGTVGAIAPLADGTPSPFRVSIVVPTRNSARTIASCLSSIRAQIDLDGSPFPVELIVVDNHSTDGTAEVAGRLAHRVVTTGPERSAQRNAGANAAAASVIAFIDSDHVLDPLVAAEAVAALDADPAAGVVVIPEHSFGEGFWAECKVLEKRLTEGDGRSEAGRFYRRAALCRAGGFDESLTSAEDWELHDRVAAAGWAVARTGAGIRHDEGRLTLRTTFAKKRYYGRWFRYYHTLPWARTAAFDPRRLLTRPTLLLRRPALAAGLVVLKAVEAAGVYLGLRAAGRSAG